MSIRRKHIRNLTRDLLRKHRVEGAPVDVYKIATAVGLEVLMQKAGEDISGFLFRDLKRGTAVIGINSRQSENRQRFTVAHEIGHFLLHSEREIHVDKGFEIQLRGAKSKEGTDIGEKEANLFAAELLMPEEFLGRDLTQLGTLDLTKEGSLTELAERYQVSTQALAFRLAYLGYF